MVRSSRKGREEWKIKENVFDSFTLKNLEDLKSKRVIDELISSYALGKEANVFLASKGDEILIVKIYRVENCNFNKMHEYICQDPRFTGLRGQKRKVIFSWVKREFKNMLICRDKINCPVPFFCYHNILVMSMIGRDVPAKQLKNCTELVTVELFYEVMQGMRDIVSAGLVHGDVSAFNILVERGSPVFIDFSQATPIDSFNAQALLERDFTNLRSFFSKYISVDFDAQLSNLIKHFKSKVKV